MPIASHNSDPRDRGNWPIYVLSSLRSGSTLLRYLLDAHERLTCPPETKFIAALMSFLEYPQIQPALRSLDISRADLFVELRLFVERIMARYTNGQHKSRWVDKTPNYYRHTDLIEQLFEGQALYIILVRHPLDCICSLDDFLPLGGKIDDPDMARIAERHGYGRYAWAQYWSEVYTKLWLFSVGRPERTIIVRYEELASCPELTLQRICEFIGESYDPAIVARAFSHQHAEGFGDPKIEQTDRVHTDSVGRWRSWPQEESETLWEQVQVPAAKFGYTISGAGALP
jgi:Sulfotransferase family